MSRGWRRWPPGSAVRVLITGATGFVGGYLAQELAAAYPDATLIGLTHGPAAHLHYPERLERVAADLTDPETVRRAVDAAAPTHVFHLAGFASAAGTDAALIDRVNVTATLDLLAALIDRGAPCRVHLASSGYVYGATAPGRPVREGDPTAPIGAYALSKARMEREAEARVAGSALSVTVTRAFNHTGPFQTPGFVAPAFARQIARIETGLDEPTVRVGNLTPRRDFLHVRDVVRAYRLLVCESEPAPWRLVNVASGVATPISEVLDTLVAAARVPVRVEVDPERVRPADMEESVGDPSALAALTGWSPSVPLADTLLETLEWWRTQV